MKKSRFEELNTLVVGPENINALALGLGEAMNALEESYSALDKISRTRGADRAAEHGYCVAIATEALKEWESEDQ